MKCPSCDHVSDKALLKCSECNEVFDREGLEKLQNLEYLLGWLEEQADILGPVRYEQLRQKGTVELEAVRQELLPEQVAVTARPYDQFIENTRSELSPVELWAFYRQVFDQISGWFATGLTDFITAQQFKEHLKPLIAELDRDRRGMPQLFRTPTNAQVDAFIVEEIPLWVEVGWLDERTGAGTAASSSDQIS